MKKIVASILCVVLVLGLLDSCKKKLEMDPTNQLDQEKALKEVNLMLIGAYSLIGSGGYMDVNSGGFYGTDVLMNADLLASENYIDWQGTFGQYRQIVSKNMISTNSSISRMWGKGYAAIGLCNTILEHISNVPEDKRARYAAEAKFIRAVAHFELLRFFGEASTGLGVPLLLKSTQVYEDITYPARASITEVYEQVIADLKEAATILPTENEVYADRYSAYGFLARVYLQKGDYTNAFVCADSVITNGHSSLPSSVENAFNTSSSIESVFEIQQTNNNNAGTANDGITTFYSCDNDTPGSASRGDISIVSDFVNLYDSTDKRRSILIYTGNCINASITSGKWKNPYTNVPIIRLSEMYLVRAEAGFRTGQGNPVKDINDIRKKAGASLYNTVNLDTILLERELELAFEGHRIHDFRRIGKVVTVVNIDSTSYEVDYRSKEFVMPIPQADINTNKNLIQNTNYR